MGQSLSISFKDYNESTILKGKYEVKSLGVVAVTQNLLQLLPQMYLERYGIAQHHFTT
jgi:hypothetical protein